MEDMVIVKCKDGEKVNIGRRVGGIAWPSDKMPGAIVIVGESYAPIVPEYTDKMLSARDIVHDYHVLDYTESYDMQDMLRTTSIFQDVYKVNTYLGRRDDSRIQTIEMYNDAARRAGRPRVSYGEAPMTHQTSLGFYIDTIAELAQKDNLRFYWHGSDLAHKMQGMSTADYHAYKEGDHPALAALGYATSVLSMNPREYV